MISAQHFKLGGPLRNSQSTGCALIGYRPPWWSPRLHFGFLLRPRYSKEQPIALNYSQGVLEVLFQKKSRALTAARRATRFFLVSFSFQLLLSVLLAKISSNLQRAVQKKTILLSALRTGLRKMAFCDGLSSTGHILFLINNFLILQRLHFFSYSIANFSPECSIPMHL